MLCQHAALHIQQVLVGKLQRANYSNQSKKKGPKKFRHTPAMPRITTVLSVLTAWQKAKTSECKENTDWCQERE